MSTLLKDMGRGCERALVIRIVAALIVIPAACVLIFLPMALFARTDASPWLMIIPAALFLLLLFGGAGVYIAVVLRRRKSMLDAAFAPWGLTGSVYDTFFRQYHGTIEGRQANVWFYRGPILELELSTSLQTRLGVTGAHGDTRFLAGLAGRQPLTLDDPALQQLTMYAHDAPWTRNLLDHPEAVRILQRLTATDEQFTRQHVILRPGTFKLMLAGNKKLFGFELTAGQVHQWFTDLLALARIAEQLPAPQVTAETSSAEQLAQKLRRRNPYLALWVALGTFFGIILCGALVTALVLLLAE